jgi:hypothetical protein
VAEEAATTAVRFDLEMEVLRVGHDFGGADRVESLRARWTCGRRGVDRHVSASASNTERERTEAYRRAVEGALRHCLEKHHTKTTYLVREPGARFPSVKRILA